MESIRHALLFAPLLGTRLVRPGEAAIPQPVLGLAGGSGRSARAFDRRETCRPGVADALGHLVEVADGERVASFEYEGDYSRSLFVSGDADRFYRGSGSKLTAHQLSTRKDLGHWSFGEESIWSGAISNDGKRIAGVTKRALKVWDSATRNELLSVETIGGRVAFSPDGKLVAQGGADDRVEVWEIAGKKRIHPWSIPLAKELGWQAVEFSPDGKLLGVGTQRGTVVVFDLTSGKEIEQIEIRSSVHSIAFSANSRHLIAGCFDDTVYLWDRDKKAIKHTWEGCGAPIWHTIFADQDQFVVASCWDGSVHTWRVDTGANVWTSK